MDQPIPTQSLLPRLCACAGAVMACLAIIFGALAAHLPDGYFAMAGRAMAQSAVSMQMWHAIALVALGLGRPLPKWTGIVVSCGFGLGTFLFCGAVYFTALTGIHPGPFAPTGGIILMVSWLILAVGVWQIQKRPC